MDFGKFNKNSRIKNEGTDSETTPILHRNGSTWLNDRRQSLNYSSFNQNNENVPVFIESPNSSTDIEHCHDHSKQKLEIDQVARKKLIFASILCLIFIIVEAVGGILSDSLAIMTDAAHLLTDFASFMISLFSIWMASRPPTKRMSFGWHRAEVIGAVTSVLMIWVITGVLVYMAVQRIITPEFNLDTNIMLITAGFGVAVNLIMGLSLHGVGHHHSHGDSSKNHSHDAAHPKKKENINVRAAFIHVIGDFFQSLGVLVAAYIIHYTGYDVIDPICTFLFSILVILTTVAILRDALTVLMEGIPKGINFNEVYTTLMTVKGVLKIHNLRIWALTIDKVAMTVHLAIEPDANPQEILKETSYLLKTCFNIFESTIQIENYSDRMRDCSQCEVPSD